MKKASILIMIISVLSKILGFLRETILGSVIGPGPITDAFLYAFSLPTTFFSMVIAAFATGLIPMFTRVENEHGTKRAMKFLNNTFNIMVIIGGLAALFLFLFTELSLSFLLSDAKPEILVYLVPFLKVTSFSIVFTAIIQILTGFLHVRGSFLTVALLGFPLNIIIIGIIFLSRNYGVDILPFGILAAYGTQALIILAYAHVKGYKWQFSFDYKDKHMQSMVILAIPLIIGSATNSIGVLFMQNLASSVDRGITMINNAQKVGGMVEGIFGLAIITVMYPALSKAISMGKYEKAKREFGEAFISEMIFIIPSMVGLLMLTKPIVQVIFMRQKFTMVHVNELTPVLFMYVLGLAFFSLHNLLVRVFYSYQDMKTPMRISIGIITMQITFGYFLSNAMGLSGITLGMALAYVVGVSVEFLLLMKKFGSFPVAKYGKQFIKLLLANGVMALSIWVCKLILQPRMGNTSFLMVTIFVAVIVYLISILFLRIETFDELIDNIRGRSRD